MGQLIGLLGEAPHDTKALEVLLRKILPEDVRFIPMINDIRGSDLENQKIKNMLRIEFQSHRPHFVVFIRDLDGAKSNKEQMTLRKKYFSEWKRIVDKKAIFLLNIQAFEALVLSDFGSYATLKGIDHKFDQDPMSIAKPEEYLKSISNYREGELAEVCKHLDPKVIASNCKYFQDFIVAIEKKLSA